MFTLKIENARGEVFELTHNSLNYSVVGVSGLTPPPTAVNTTPGGALDGTFHNSSRVDQRNIVIDIVINGDIETNRQRLYRMFNLKKPCVIYFKNQNRDVKITGYVETLDGDLFSMREQMQISIICPRPYFEDLQAISTELSTIVREFEFPFAIEMDEPVEMSSIQDTPNAVVVNNGDVESGCVITVELSGTVHDLVIYNATTREYFGLNYTFSSGHRVVIDTRSGSMSAKLFNGVTWTNLLNAIISGSTWFKLAVGDNVFTYVVNDDPADVNITIETSNLYGGV